MSGDASKVAQAPVQRSPPVRCSRAVCIVRAGEDLRAVELIRDEHEMNSRIGQERELLGPAFARWHLPRETRFVVDGPHAKAESNLLQVGYTADSTRARFCPGARKAQVKKKECEHSNG